MNKKEFIAKTLVAAKEAEAIAMAVGPWPAKRPVYVDWRREVEDWRRRSSEARLAINNLSFIGWGLTVTVEPYFQDRTMTLIVEAGNFSPRTFNIPLSEEAFKKDLEEWIRSEVEGLRESLAGWESRLSEE